MATYDDTIFFWLKLKEDFFDEPTIRWIESQPSGTDYAYFYLKLCVKSLKTNGILIQKVGNKLIPYDEKTLASYTFTDIKIVTPAINLFIEIGLIEKLDNGALYMREVENLIGSQSKGAFKKQQQRLKNCQRTISYKEEEEDKCPPLCPPELELEKELELDVCICQRGKEFKDHTCKDCWNYNICTRKNYIVHKAQKEEPMKKSDETPTQTIEELEEFFKNRKKG